MSLLEESIRYLELRLAECQGRPELHQNQIAAYQYFLEMARASSDGDDYTRRIRETGNMFQLARAESMDRYQNLVRIHQTVQDDRKLRGDFLNLNAARDAQSHQDLNTRMTAAATEAQQWTQAGMQSVGQVRSVLCELVDWALECKPEVKPSKLAMLQHSWGLLKQADPDCTWEKLCSYPPYRQRIPFDDARLAQLGVWFKEAIG